MQVTRARSVLEDAVGKMRDLLPEEKHKLLEGYVQQCLGGDVDALRNLRFLMEHYTTSFRSWNNSVDAFLAFREAFQDLRAAELASYKEEYEREPRKPVLMAGDQYLMLLEGGSR